ncbi:MAG: galactosyldiacylglycerol synthase [Anaerolineales bacterium]|nr:galactosyldiacylglycerol synthase [Anaerolineales bacterium]
MNKSLSKRPHILFLFSDTGGGHRSAAEAIIEALQLEYGDAITSEMVDIFLDYAPPPLNRLPSLYPTMVKLPHAWGLGYRLSNGDRRASLITGSAWPYLRRSIRRLIANHPCDMIVSVHPLANAPVLRGLGQVRPTYITVVTDLVTTHALWYHRRTDLCIVASEEAYQRAIRFGLKPGQVQIVGLPVADRFCQPPGDRQALRERFGWPQNRPLILLVGGGEGMGPLEKTAQSIAQSCPTAGLIVIAGRNQELKSRLEAMTWPVPTFIYGFVREMPDFMRAADILVTKAGPGTISEALIAGLPMILYSRLPGQEDGNVSYVVSEGAGIWAPRPEQIITTLQNWLKHPEQLSAAAAACQRLAQPQAARKIACILAEKLRITRETQHNT